MSFWVKVLYDLFKFVTNQNAIFETLYLPDDDATSTALFLNFSTSILKDSPKLLFKLRSPTKIVNYRIIHELLNQKLFRIIG